MSFQVDGTAEPRVTYIGVDQNPVMVLDDCLVDTSALMVAAADARFGPPPGGYYPGPNAGLPRTYVADLVTALRPVLHEVFGLPAAESLQLMGYFGLATQAAEDLQPIQRVPHHDTTEPGQLALLHFLCGREQGGTAFYRHDATGFETLDETRYKDFTEIRRRELEAGVPLHHVSALTPGYTQIGTFEARFNRLIVYRANSLHSGLLGISHLSPDPMKGRLTANSFARRAS